MPIFNAAERRICSSFHEHQNYILWGLILLIGYPSGKSAKRWTSWPYNDVFHLISSNCQHTTAQESTSKNLITIRSFSFIHDFYQEKHRDSTVTNSPRGERDDLIVSSQLVQQWLNDTYQSQPNCEPILKEKNNQYHLWFLQILRWILLVSDREWWHLIKSEWSESEKTWCQKKNKCKCCQTVLCFITCRTYYVHMWADVGVNSIFVNSN